MAYEERAKKCSHPLARRLLNIMADKKTNLALSADVTSSQQLIQVREEFYSSCTGLQQLAPTNEIKFSVANILQNPIIAASVFFSLFLCS